MGNFWTTKAESGNSTCGVSRTTLLGTDFIGDRKVKLPMSGEANKLETPSHTGRRRYQAEELGRPQDAGWQWPIQQDLEPCGKLSSYCCKHYSKQRRGHRLCPFLWPFSFPPCLPTGLLQSQETREPRSCHSLSYTAGQRRAENVSQRKQANDAYTLSYSFWQLVSPSYVPYSMLGRGFSSHSSYDMVMLCLHICFNFYLLVSPALILGHDNFEQNISNEWIMIVSIQFQQMLIEHLH